MRAPAKAFLWVCVLVAAVGCGRKSAPGYFGSVVPKHGPDEVWINGGGEPEYIDPGKCSDAVGGAIIVNLFSGLLQPHPKTLEPMPDLARGWKVSDDRRLYTFKLRPSTWSDGHPLTAHDFEYSWKRVLDPKTASKYGTFLYPLENGDAFHQRALWLTGVAAGATNEQVKAAFAKLLPVADVRLVPERGWAFVFVGPVPEGQPDPRDKAIAATNGKPLAGATIQVRIADGSVVGVKALDDLTLEVRLDSPIPYFLNLLSYYTTMPVPRHVIEPLVAAGKAEDLWTRPENIVVNGPYIIKSWKFRQEILFEKNPRYWDAANVKMPRVRSLMVDDENTTLNLYKTGDLDWIGESKSVPSEYVDHMAGYRDFHKGPYLAVYYYWFNTTRPPLDNPLVRRALSLAVDRESITRYVTRSGEIPTADFVPDGLAGYRGLKGPLFDPDRARALLRQAGYPGGKGLPTISILYNTLEGHKLIAQAIQQMWKKHLGVDAQLENQEWKVYLKSTHQLQFQVARAGWIGDYPDPFTFLELVLSNNGNNHSGWVNAEYDTLLRDANRAQGRTRLELLRRAEKIAMDETPVMPLYVYARGSVWKPYLRGMWHNYQTRHQWKYFHIEKRFYDGVPEVPHEDPPPPLVPPEVMP